MPKPNSCVSLFHQKLMKPFLRGPHPFPSRFCPISVPYRIPGLSPLFHHCCFSFRCVFFLSLSWFSTCVFLSPHSLSSFSLPLSLHIYIYIFFFFSLSISLSICCTFHFCLCLFVFLSHCYAPNRARVLGFRLPFRVSLRPAGQKSAEI